MVLAGTFFVFVKTVILSKNDKILYLLNKQHKNIKFTVEHESETLPLLELELTIADLILKQRFTENNLTLACY